MSALLRTSTGIGRIGDDDVPDQANPVFVREIARGYASKAAYLPLLTFGVLACGAVVYAGWAGGRGTDAAAGGALFDVVVRFILVPAAATEFACRGYFGVREEIGGRMVDDLALTGLTSTRILNGHFLAAAARFGILLGVMAPCFAMAYVFRGVSLYAMASTIVSVVGTFTCVAYLSVCFACIGGRPLEATPGFISFGFATALACHVFMSRPVAGLQGDGFTFSIDAGLWCCVLVPFAGFVTFVIFPWAFMARDRLVRPYPARGPYDFIEESPDDVSPFAKEKSF